MAPELLMDIAILDSYGDLALKSISRYTPATA